MARPSRNNADYFTHMANLRNDRRIKAIRARYGAAGYGVIIMFMEALTDADYTQLDTSELELELLSGDFGVSVTEIDSILQTAVKIGLFSRNEAGMLICEDLNKALEPVFDKRNRARNASQTPKETISVTETTDTVTESTQSKVKESKGKNSRKKELTHVDADASGDSKVNPVTLLKNLFILKTPGYYWQTKDATHGKELIQKMRHRVATKANKNPEEIPDTEVISAIGTFLDQRTRLQPRYQTADVPVLNSDFNKIMEELNLKKNGNHVTTANIPQPVKAGRPD